MNSVETSEDTPAAERPAVSRNLRALELFCGIGGFAAAVAGSNVEVVGALDQDRAALSVYRHNFPSHPLCSSDLERATAEELAAYRAKFWWLSPPCQPYSVRGRRRDLEDPRARSLARVTEVLALLPAPSLPAYLALENVPGFAVSAARDQLVGILAGRGYALREFQICPTDLGVPSRRPRYYLVASRRGLAAQKEVPPKALRPLSAYLSRELNAATPPELLLDQEVLRRFGNGLRILHPVVPGNYTTCFTASYGKSLMHAGSYLRTPAGVRRFAPEEIARLLGFPERFSFPQELSLRSRWHLVGNSLSVLAVRRVLTAIPEIVLDPLTAP